MKLGCYAIKNNYMILSNHTVHSVLECSELCSWQSLCIAFYHRDIPNEINCQLTNYTKEYLQRSFCDGEWTLFQDENIPATLVSSLRKILSQSYVSLRGKTPKTEIALKLKLQGLLFSCKTIGHTHVHKYLV